MGAADPFFGNDPGTVAKFRAYVSNVRPLVFAQRKAAHHKLWHTSKFDKYKYLCFIPTWPPGIMKNSCHIYKYHSRASLLSRSDPIVNANRLNSGRGNAVPTFQTNRAAVECTLSLEFGPKLA